MAASAGGIGRATRTLRNDPLEPRQAGATIDAGTQCFADVPDRRRPVLCLDR